MTRREDVKGYVLVDDSGRITVIGEPLRNQLRARAGYYTHVPSERTLLHFTRATSVPAFEEFRDPIVLQGDIAGMGSTVEIINFVTAAKLSGNLVFVSNQCRKCLYFKSGEVRGASSNIIEDRLGEVMFRFGALSREELERAIAEGKRFRRPLGNYLLDQGTINQAELYIFIRRQVEEIFYSVLLIKDGDFYLTKFDVDALPSPLSLNANSMLMDGLRRSDEIQYFKQRIHSSSVRVAKSRETPPEGTKLEAKDLVILSALNTVMTVEELTRACRLGEFDTMKILFHLVGAGHVKVLEERDFVTTGVDITEITTEMSGMVDTFNSVFQRIYTAISKHDQHNALKQGLDTFLQFYGFVELFQGVAFDATGALDKRALLTNLNQNQIDNRATFLSQALNELLFFEMFAAREWLERDEQQELQKIINQLFIEIG
ncbi:MAG: DUF4388 domain-containing protein [Myxococcales bacterium]|nr:DUF4388 domain-containing protein [Myxococcales bacterium]